MLEANQWNLEISVDQFFNNPPPNAYDFPTDQKSFNANSIQQLFAKYSGMFLEITSFCFFSIRHLFCGLLSSTDDGEVIHEEGMQRFITDIGADSDDLLSLIIAWLLNAKTLGEFTKAEFVEGFTTQRFK